MRGLCPMLIAFVVAGCRQTALPPATDTGQAREALTAALQTWKEGRPAETLRERSPAIDFRDTNWEQGARLQDFAVEKTETSGLSARFTVKLLLAGSSGGARERVVIYNADTGKGIIIRPNF